jgi:hypothetical protein
MPMALMRSDTLSAMNTLSRMRARGDEGRSAAGPPSSGDARSSAWMADEEMRALDPAVLKSIVSLARWTPSLIAAADSLSPSSALSSLSAADSVERELRLADERDSRMGIEMLTGDAGGDSLVPPPPPTLPAPLPPPPPPPFSLPWPPFRCVMVASGGGWAVRPRTDPVALLALPSRSLSLGGDRDLLRDVVVVRGSGILESTTTAAPAPSESRCGSTTTAAPAPSERRGCGESERDCDRLWGPLGLGVGGISIRRRHGSVGVGLWWVSCDRL